MKYWLQSLSENGFDVFTLVYIAILLIMYHYLLRWYLDIRFNGIKKQIDIVNETLNDVLDELEEVK
tara:strand:- start:4971 stop:5168 length:198 start_codon:yes stop_codon:yes gene_type:complete